MGKEAVDQDALEDLETEQPNEDEVIVEEEESSEGQETEDTEGEEGQEDAPQFTQHQLDNIVLKQKDKLNAKLDKATETSEQTNTELALANEKIKLQNIAIEQLKGTKQAPAEPNPDDFDGGTNDPEYLKKQGEYTQSIIQQEVTRQVAEASKQTETTTNINAQAETLNRLQTGHYEKVKEAKIKDYFTHEDSALEILGNDVVNQIISNFPDESHLLLNYLGTPANKDESEQLAMLIKTKPIKGVAKIGSIIEGKLSTKSKPKPAAPDPDEDVSGGSVQPSKRGPKGASYT